LTAGHFRFDDRSAGLLLEALPPLLVIGADEECGTPLRAGLDLLAPRSWTSRTRRWK
jgi:hypothetical protein